MDYRFTKEDLEHDPEYMSAAFPTGKTNDWYPGEDNGLIEHCSERIFFTLVRVAEAYQLHFPTQLSENLYDRSVMRNAQVESLLDQLEFIYELVNDNELKKCIKTISKLGGKVCQSNGKLELVFEGP